MGIGGLEIGLDEYEWKQLKEHDSSEFYSGEFYYGNDCQ